MWGELQEEHREDTAAVDFNFNTQYAIEVYFEGLKKILQLY